MRGHCRFDVKSTSSQHNLYVIYDRTGYEVADYCRMASHVDSIEAWRLVLDVAVAGQFVQASVQVFAPGRAPHGVCCTM